MKIYVTHSKTAGFQWGLRPATLHSLDIPLTTTNVAPVVIEIYSVGPTGIFSRLQNGASGKLSPREPAEQEVPLGGKRTCSFSTRTSGDYEVGVVEVMPFAK
jgi:hypothetical protein